MKELDLGNRIPVIFMTGHGDLDTAVQVMREGAFDFVTKPFSTLELMTKVEAALASSGAANQSEGNQKKILNSSGNSPVKRGGDGPDGQERPTEK